MIVFLVTRPDFTLNIIVEASEREIAKRYAQQFLGGDPDYYVVTPLTKRRSRTIFLLGMDR